MIEEISANTRAYVDGDVPPLLKLSKQQRIERVVEHWRTGNKRHHFSSYRYFPAFAGKFEEMPQDIHAALKLSLAQRGISALYSHQAEAWRALREGRDIVVATPTASGKSLCYTLPILNRLVEDPEARALLVFPTKALARDQVENLRSQLEQMEVPIGIAVYDGDTPADQRRVARRRARIIATNAEMIHTGILPHHPMWAELLSSLSHVVVDELHVYRGIFGSHMAHVMQRLLRVAKLHGSAPQFVSTSATIRNPGELSERILGRRTTVIDGSGAPSGPRHFFVYNPPEIDQGLGLRQNYLKATTSLAHDLADAQLGTLVFARHRKGVEILLRYLRDSVGAFVRDPIVRHQRAQRVRSYRGGYLPERRREVECALREGNTDIVVSTSALELGIDVGGLDAVVIAGWPGSRAATWQRAGRAGRRQEPCINVVVASSEPLDQFVVNDDAYLFSQRVEQARIDPDNPAVLFSHLGCSLAEAPLAKSEPYGTLSLSETAVAVEHLCQEGVAVQGDQFVHYRGDPHPARNVRLRGPLDENFTVIAEPEGSILAEVDYHAAPQELHQGAIYQLEGEQFEVLRLDTEGHKAFVKRVNVDYYTTAITQMRLQILQPFNQTDSASWGDIHVSESTPGFKKIKLHTHENVGYGEIHQPDRDIHTIGCWLLPAPTASGLAADFSAPQVAQAALALANVLHLSATVMLMSEKNDLRTAVGDQREGWFSIGQPSDPPSRSGCPTIFIFDTFPGGTGLAERLYEARSEWLDRAATQLERCRCARGCPACVGPNIGPEARPLAGRLLKTITAHT